MRPFRFGLQLAPDDVTRIGPVAARAEELGFDTVVVPDHVGSDWSPILTLTAAAAATERIRLGTFVINCCLQHPLMLAREIATLDHLADGRIELGLGAGHTPAEFAATGTPFEPAPRRKARLASFATIIRALLDGETVDHHDDFYNLTNASTHPATQSRVPILIGGHGRALLTHAAHHADIVGLSGLGKTLPDGHRHTAHFEPWRLDEHAAIVRDAASGRERDVELNALVQVVSVTDDREAAARELTERIEGLTLEDALSTPFLALGTVDEIAAQLTAARERWGISYFVVREADDFAPVIAALR